jgi:anti-sigma regulatory factor (Ser/Thr protein kinase)
VPVVSWAWLEIPHASSVCRERRRDGGTRPAESAAHSVHRLRWQRTGSGGMSKAAPAISQTHIFDGSPEEIQNVRAFVGQIVAGFPATDDVVLLSSEIATNAVLHSASGADGTFSVSVLVESGWVRVEVHDLGSDTAPTIRRSRQPGESGAGLSLVEMIADRWGFHGGQRGRVVWFEMDWN